MTQEPVTSATRFGPFTKGEEPDDLPGQIERLGVGQAIVQTPEMSQAATVEMRSAGDSALV